MRRGTHQQQLFSKIQSRSPGCTGALAFQVNQVLPLRGGVVVTPQGMIRARRPDLAPHAEAKAKAGAKPKAKAVMKADANRKGTAKAKAGPMK